MGALGDKAYMILIRLLAIATFASSVFACYSPHHNVSINEQPYVEHVFDIHCEDLTGDSQQYCKDSVNTLHYTLWRVFDNFFSFQEEWHGGAFCGHREFDVALAGDLLVGNLGDCTTAQANIVAAFTILACSFAAFSTIYITVLADEAILPSSRLAHYYFAGMVLLLISTFACSAVAIATYTLFLDPLRLDPTFCQQQTLFQYCVQSMGDGFWFQVATLAMAFINLVLAGAWRVFGSPPGTIAGSKNNSKQKPEQPQHAQQHPPFYCSLHFYVQLVRFSELAILIIGIMSTFTQVQTTIPPNGPLTAPTTANPITNTSLTGPWNAPTTTIPISNTTTHPFHGNGGQMDTEITLWQGLFCHDFGARMFLWSVTLGELRVPNESFGQCERKDLFECQMGYIMAMVTAITAMAFAKDAKSMPLAYMIGFVMHFLSMVKLSWAIGAFMTKVYPGRNRIDPSYCSLWTTYIPGATCSIDIGPGLIYTSVALGTVAVSFIGELILQRKLEHGVGTAFRTLTGRVRQGRFSDLIKSTSERVLDVGHLDSSERPLDGTVIQNKTTNHFEVIQDKTIHLDQNNLAVTGSVVEWAVGVDEASVDDDPSELPKSSKSIFFVIVILLMLLVMILVAALVSVVIVNGLQQRDW